MESPQEEAILVKLLTQAAQTFDSGIVVAAQGKEATLKKALASTKSHFTLAEKSAPIQGGFLLDAGTIEGDFSFESILKKELWEGLELRLNQLLFS